MRVVLVLLFFIILVNAEELLLDDLLKEYAQSEELNLQTKKESGGHLVVYSREDLERMQAYTLKDILKKIRVFTLQTNYLGLSNLVRSGQSQKATNPVKLYINDHELSSAIHGNALMTYGDMDLYFVNHIEIYQGGSSIALGNEPGSTVIRLYTKDPDRENSRSAQVSVDSEGGSDLRGVDAGMIGDYSYLLYADVANNRHETYDRDGYELSRDGERYQFHFGFSKKDDFEITANAILNKSDIFNGYGTAPLGGGSERFYGYLSAIKYLPNDFKVTVSIAAENQEMQNRDDEGIDLADGSRTNDLEAVIDGTVYKAQVDKRIVDGNSDLLVGIQWEQKHINIDSYTVDGIDATMVWGPTTLDIYRAYIEELYNINKEHLLAFSANLDHYKNNFGKGSEEYALRLGYIALLDEAWTFKAFGVRRYQYPYFLLTSFSPVYHPNPDLKSETILTATGELIYQNAQNKVFFGVGYGEVEDAFVFSEADKKYVNQDSTGRFKRVLVRAEHSFDLDNKIVVEWYKFFKDKYVSPGDGALIQLFNKIGKLDIYNELVYRADYSVNGIDMNKGYDYTLGIIYPVNRQLDIKLKGENLLDRATEVPIGSVEVPAVDRRVTATVEYTF